MELNLHIQGHEYRISIGSGYNDWVWLSHYAGRLYSNSIYPRGTYIPTMLTIQYSGIEYQPHPREKIILYLQEHQISPAQVVEVYVQLRQLNHTLNENQKKWAEKAYGKDRFFITCNFSYKIDNLNRQKDFYFMVKITHMMSSQVKSYFFTTQYPSVIDFKLTENIISPVTSLFTGQYKLPYGQISYKLFYCEKQLSSQEYQQYQLTDKKIKKDDFKVTMQPKYVPIEKINTIINEEMKISDNLTKRMEEKQMETKKRNASSSLCCYNLQQLWSILETQYEKQLSLSKYQESTCEKIKVTLEKNMSSLYEIFFYYFIIEQQQKDKKEQIVIHYQHAMHFLKAYQIVTNIQDIHNFWQLYNTNHFFQSIEHTLNIEQFGISFPHFIAIILKSIQFIQTATDILKGQSFDCAVTKIIQIIITIDTEEQQFSSFHRNLRQSPKIISYIRSNSTILKQIYRNKINSISNIKGQFTIKKQNIKELLIQSTLNAKNIDKIISQCWIELNLSQEGIYYYQFLEVVQWLALATISSIKQEQFMNSEEQEAVMLIQKINYFLHKIKP